MSIVSYTTRAPRYPDQKLEVQAGWDPALRRFFLVVDSIEEDTTLYSNLDEPDPSAIGQDTTYFTRKLLALGIEAPESFWPEVRKRGGNTALFLGHHEPQVAEKVLQHPT